MRTSAFRFLPLAALLFLGACKKKEAEKLLDNVSATIGAVSFDTKNVTKAYTTSGNPTQLTITANGASGEQLVLAIKDFDKTNPIGTYTISTIGHGIGAYQYAGCAADENADTGEIDIALNVNGGVAISGSFDFTTQTGTHVSNGAFFVVLP